MKIAALDLGSNTSLLLIAEVRERTLLKILHDETRVTKMGQGVHANRKFHPEALARLDQCFADYSATIQKSRCDRVIAVATSAARDVSNGEELLRLGKKHGIPIHIISGDEEALLTFQGALSDRSQTEGIAVVDVGGGSTEMIINGKGTSIDVGSVRLTELFNDDQQKLRQYCQQAFQNASLPNHAIQEVVAVAGTPTTLAALEQKRDFDVNIVHGFKLSRATIESWIKRLAEMTVDQREQLPGMQPKRADVIVAGSIVLSEALGALGQQQATVSTRGVRYGVALACESFQ